MAQSKYKIFLSVVESGSLTRAAEKCGVTQSAVSHALHALESAAGLPLLIRNRSGVRLTSEGEKLLPAIRRIVEALDAFHTEVSALRGQEGGCIRIGAFTSVAVHWLPRIIKEYQARNPAVDFRMLGGDYHDIAQGFADGSISSHMGADYLLQQRITVTGSQMAHSPSVYASFFDPATLLDPQRGTVPQ